VLQLYLFEQSPEKLVQALDSITVHIRRIHGSGLIVELTFFRVAQDGHHVLQLLKFLLGVLCHHEREKLGFGNDQLGN
jgi:hypothetical protein